MLDTKQRTFLNVVVRDPHHNSDQFMVLGFLIIHPLQVKVSYVLSFLVVVHIKLKITILLIIFTIMIFNFNRNSICIQQYLIIFCREKLI